MRKHEAVLYVTVCTEEFLQSIIPVGRLADHVAPDQEQVVLLIDAHSKVVRSLYLEVELYFLALKGRGTSQGDR